MCEIEEKLHGKKTNKKKQCVCVKTQRKEHGQLEKEKEDSHTRTWAGGREMRWQQRSGRANSAEVYMSSGLSKVK